MKFLTFNYIGLVLLAACSQSAKDATRSNGFQVAVVDSIQVNYLGNLGVMDFDSTSGLYLGRNNSNDEIVLFDDDGTISHQFTFQKDGPNAVGWTLGLGFFNNKVTVMEVEKGISVFNPDGTHYKKIPIPKDYIFINGLNFPVRQLGDKLVYYRPERGEFDWQNQADIFKRIYSSPLLEVLDTLSGNIAKTMAFPPNTIYEDGNYYHWMFPIIIKNENEWLLSLMAERKYHVYIENGHELTYSRTVDLDLEDAVDMKGVPLSNSSQMYEVNRFNVFGRFQEIYSHDGLVLVAYAKGVKEEIAMQYDPQDREEWGSFVQGIPRYLAVFDRDHQLLCKDLPLPQGIHLTPVINHQGEILAIKNQEYWGVEEDFGTIYKIKLSQ
jgi:hypothetical protein